ncbi:hypothetical protein ACHAXM_012149 [Skeletonema potamos]|jgi:hypothetical protein
MMAPSPTSCYCGGDGVPSASIPSAVSQTNHLSCRICAARHLSSKIARYSASKQKRLEKKREAQLRLLETRLLPADELDDGGADTYTHQIDIDGFSHGKSKRRPLPDPNQINQHVMHLKERLDKLRSQSNDLAVSVTAKTMKNNERQANLELYSQQVILAQERLNTMKHCLVLQADEKKLDGAPNNDFVCDGRLRDALDHGRHQIQSLRFQYALRVFDMHRIDVGEEYSNENKGNINKNNATGVGKIGGLPLPHAGPALYSVLPQGVLASSLRLVASLTNLVSRCLGVVLPHPILVCAKECSRCRALYDFGGDVIDTISFDDNDIDEGLCDDACISLCDACCQEGSSSPGKIQRGTAHGSKSNVSHAKMLTPNTTHSPKKSLISFVGASARKAIALTASAMTNAQNAAYSSGASAHAKSEQSTSSQVIATSPYIITKRINHASFAVLAESYESGATEYVLNPPRLKEDGGSNEGKILSPVNEAGTSSNSQSQLFSNREDFHSAEERFFIGVQLLQNDVIALCFRAGVDVSKLWPAESVLLNLNALLQHCRTQIM